MSPSKILWTAVRPTEILWKNLHTNDCLEKNLKKTPNSENAMSLIQKAGKALSTTMTC